MSVIVPAIKSQGIKTKLVPWINDIVLQSGLDIPNTNWIEPFFGTERLLTDRKNVFGTLLRL